MEIDLDDDLWDIGAAVQAAALTRTPTPVYNAEGRRVATIVPYEEEG
jgi:hypothetical protein